MVLERVISALKESGRLIDACEFGEIVVKTQDGEVTLVEVTSKNRPRHTRRGGSSGPGEHEIFCNCGFEAKGKTYEAAEEKWDAHLIRNT